MLGFSKYIHGIAVYPGALIRQMIGDDPRFFPPEVDDSRDASVRLGDHNYNENQALIEAISKGSRGAYWDILRQLHRG